MFKWLYTKGVSNILGGLDHFIRVQTVVVGLVFYIHINAKFKNWLGIF